MQSGGQETTTKKAPYSEYGALSGEGVQIQWGDPADPSALPDGPFDVVYDNNGKKLDVCKAAIDKYKVPPRLCPAHCGVQDRDALRALLHDAAAAASQHKAMQQTIMYLVEMSLGLQHQQELLLQGRRIDTDWPNGANPACHGTARQVLLRPCQPSIPRGCSQPGSSC